MASAFDLSGFSVTDMVVASGELRAVTAGAASMEEGSAAIVEWLRHAFTDPATGRPAFALARMFHTVTWDRLTPDLRSYVGTRDPAAAANDDGLPYLTLLATSGDHPHWSDRRNSRDHQAIPLSASDVVRRAPLALALLDRLLGLQPSPEPVPARPHGGESPAASARLRDRFDVFHVPEALGSPYVPTPEFVRDYQIRSAIALGAVLDSGGPDHPDLPGVRNTSLYTALLYSRVRIPAETATHFRTLAAAIRLALTPLLAVPLFAPSSPAAGHQVFGARNGNGSGTGLGNGVAGAPTGNGAPPAAGSAPAGNGAAGNGAAGNGHRPSVNLVPQQASAPPPSSSSVPAAAGDGNAAALAAEAELRASQRRLTQETRIVETLYMIGQSLHRELDTRKIAKLATDAATTAIDAEFGSCFYTLTSANGQAQTRFALAGTVPAERFENLPMPRPTSLVGAAFPGTAPIRSGDVTADPRYGQRAPFHGLPPGHPPVKSFLALPITTIGGTVLGSMYFGHSEPNRFTERDEQIVKGIAGQAASAMDNARLYRLERETAVELQNSLLPASPPQLAELEIAFTYLAGAQGTQVGGDWFDVIPLSGGRVALVIGDVMGRGIRAAAIMGQLRTAVRAYAVMDLPPGQIMHLLNRLVCTMPASAASSSVAVTTLSASGTYPVGTGALGPADDGVAEQIATCVYAVYDPAEEVLTWASAGHMPPALITPEGTAHLLEDDLGMPLGIEEAVFDEKVQTLAGGSRLLLYTDGLVECHDAPLTERLNRLSTELVRSDDGPLGSSGPLSSESVQRTCDRLLHAMLSGDEHDDVALLMVRTRPTRIRKAALDLDPDPMAARAARRFVTATLSEWDLDHLTDDVLSVVTELVTNATQHAATTSQLALRSHPGRLMVEVADCDGRIPRPAVTQHMDERHRGLLIVAQLSQRWGVRPTDRGKIVWAEMGESAGE
ncbi:protein serine phosphatase with GAF(s) sensor(s) [Catenulispora acidiphila DSM 44928]|uniref:Protein serine phosphatase with GAF(S) sensor(S) n=1 Tax=Catenulispora acidiphila (strain DSM 44928 / JCM 14897 / NBRC 102108 / NRRL B-24433 / ID139908) TaxID=479433 RepID=C7Q803_CATAD|nr:SpoIIE family protein phosphatase [Catenulispora acidiphila]ACU74170.1 protein serine phosphatase with GAF(s) sensor(s) [Catenulispora acidiphila DSM 44928]